MGSQSYTVKKDKKNLQIHFHSKRPHTITKMDNYMDSTIRRSMNADYLLGR